MKVMCIATELTDEKAKEIGISQKEYSCYFTVGEIYTVLGLTCSRGPKAAFFLQMKYDFGILIQIPLNLFRIVDDRVSRLWRIKQFDDADLAFWPEEFYQEFFHDDLSNQDPKVWEIFLKVVEKLENEFNE